MYRMHRVILQTRPFFTNWPCSHLMSFASFFLELFMSRSSDGLGFCGPFTVSAIPVLQAKPPEPSREEPLQVEEPKMDQENEPFHRGNLNREENRSVHIVSFFHGSPADRMLSAVPVYQFYHIYLSIYIYIYRN